ncbi:MAG: hypothetical protein ACREVR_10695, partial [Burkholderiales bacterium]
MQLSAAQSTTGFFYSFVRQSPRTAMNLVSNPDLVTGIELPRLQPQRARVRRRRGRFIWACHSNATHARLEPARAPRDHSAHRRTRGWATAPAAFHLAGKHRG